MGRGGGPIGSASFEPRRAKSDGVSRKRLSVRIAGRSWVQPQRRSEPVELEPTAVRNPWQTVSRAPGATRPWRDVRLEESTVTQRVDLERADGPGAATAARPPVAPGALDLDDGPAGRRPDRRRDLAGRAGQAGGRPAGDHRRAGRGPPADRGRPRHRQDGAGQVAGPNGRLDGQPGAVHPRPDAERRHRGQHLRPAVRRSSSSAPARSSPTSWSPTRSTGPRPRPSRRCWSAWRNGRSPSTAPAIQLARPFLVLATQNPVEMEGTYPLPEAQRDRFLARLSIGYPDRNAEIAMLADRDRVDPLDTLRPVTDAAMISGLIDAVAHRAPGAAAAAVHRRDRRRDPGRAGGPARRLTPRRAAPGARRQGGCGAGRPARSSCRTTSSGSPSRCWPTGCC